MAAAAGAGGLGGHGGRLPHHHQLLTPPLHEDATPGWPPGLGAPFQPNNWELGALHESLRNLQFEVSTLRHKLQGHEREASQIGLRWGRRLVVLSNLMLGLRCFFRAASSLPLGGGGGGVPAHGALPGASVAQQRAAWRGLLASWPFFLCAGVHLTTQAWRRDLSFLASAGYSLYVGFLASKPFARTGNATNVLVNLFYLAARYYYLHGLLTFANMQVM